MYSKTLILGGRKWMPKVTQLVLERAASRTQISWLLVLLCYRAKLAWAQGCRNASQIKASSIVQQAEHLPVFDSVLWIFPGPWRHCTFLLCQARKGAGMLVLVSVSCQFSCPWGPRIMPLPYGILPLFPLNCTRKQEFIGNVPFPIVLGNKNLQTACPYCRFTFKFIWGKFPGCPVVRTLYFHWWGHEFSPWMGNSDLTSCVAFPLTPIFFIWGRERWVGVWVYK